MAKAPTKPSSVFKAPASYVFPDTDVHATLILVQMACAKHLIANNQEHWRYGLSADVDDRTLHEIYWWPFLRSIEVRGVSVLRHGGLTTPSVGRCRVRHVRIQSFKPDVFLSQQGFDHRSVEDGRWFQGWVLLITAQHPFRY